MSSDDTSTLFEPSPDQPPALSLRQGIVQAWDPDTGENTVQVAGGVLANLPSLTAESAELVAGDVVAILSTEDRLLVIGKVTTPGDPGTVPTWNADLTALAPLVDIAAVTDGTTMTGIGVEDSTITGSLFRTAITGKRWELDSVNHANQMRGYSGEANETAPGLVEIDSFVDFASALIGAPDLGGAVPVEGPFLYLTTDKTVASPAAYSYLNSDFLYLQGRANNTFGVLVDCSADGVTFDTTALSPTGGIGFSTNGPMTVNGAAVLTTATARPYFYGYLSAAQSIPNNAATTVTGWVADGSPNSSGITHSSGLFTVPTDGRYRLRAQAWWAAIASPAGARTAQWRLSPNTTLASHTIPPSSVAATPNVIDKTVRLTAGQQVFLQVQQVQGAAVSLTGTGPDITYAQIEWVGP